MARRFCCDSGRSGVGCGTMKRPLREFDRPERSRYAMNAAPSSSVSPMTPTRQSLASPPCWPLVVSFGGGTNSAAILIEMARRKVRPDLIMFADTGGELPETIRFVADFSAWLEAHDMPPVVTVREGRQTLEQEVLAANTLPSLAFGFRSCSDKYKVRPQE